MTSSVSVSAPARIRTGSPSAILAVILGCWLGLYAGKNHGGLLDRIFSGVAYLFNSMPTFWLGMMGILLFASTLRWLPTQGMYNLRAGYTGMAHVGSCPALRWWRSKFLPISALQRPRSCR